MTPCYLAGRWISAWIEKDAQSLRMSFQLVFSCRLWPRGHTTQDTITQKVFNSHLNQSRTAQPKFPTFPASDYDSRSPIGPMSGRLDALRGKSVHLKVRQRARDLGVRVNVGVGTGARVIGRMVDAI